jgi:hypothetical protein
MMRLRRLSLGEINATSNLLANSAEQERPLKCRRRSNEGHRSNTRIERIFYVASIFLQDRSLASVLNGGRGGGGGEDATSFIVLYGNELDQKIRKRFLLVTRMRSSRNEFLGIRDDPSVFVKKKVRKEASIDEYNNEIRSNSNIKILLSSETSCSTYLGGEYPPSERANVFLSSSA